MLVALSSNGGALGRLYEPGHAKQHDMLLPQGTRAPEGCKRLLWFMGLSEERQEMNEVFWNQLVVTMLSARERAPSLQPIIVWLSQPNSHTEWFERMGGIVLYHRLTFLDKMEAAVAQGTQSTNWLRFSGAYARLDAPFLTLQLREMFNPEVFELDYIFYTDVDVIFFKDINTCVLEPPRYLRYGAEAFRNNISCNTGVMYMNVTAMVEERDALLATADAHGWNTISFDQGLMNIHFEGRIDHLPDTFNWKVYWGSNEDIYVLHFHGPKPAEECYQCYIEGVEDWETNPRCECNNPSFPTLFGFAQDADGAELMREAERMYRAYLGPRYYHLTGLGEATEAN